MKRLIKFCIIILALKVATIATFAQGGSNYSIFGFGDFNSAISSSFEGTAGTAVAMPSSSTINFTNPALISQISTTRLQVGYRFNQNIISGENSSIWQNNGGINAISIVFAFDTSRKLAGSFGLVPLSKVNYLVSKSFSEPYNGTEIKGNSLYRGSGGLSAFYGTIAGKLFGELYLGATLYGNFGAINYHNEISYTDQFAFTTYYDQKDFLSGLGYKLGAYYELPYNLKLGAYYQDFGKLSVERESSYSSELLVDSTFNYKFTATSPKALGFGISYQTGKFLIGFDYKTLDASNLNYGFSAGNKFLKSGDFSLGLVRQGNFRSNAPMLDRSTFRFGFSYSNLYYEVSKQQISETKFTIGAGIPFSTSGIVDAAFIFGKRGTTDNGLVRELFGKLVIDISIGEGWFIPFKREF